MSISSSRQGCGALEVCGGDKVRRFVASSLLSRTGVMLLYNEWPQYWAVPTRDETRSTRVYEMQLPGDVILGCTLDYVPWLELCFENGLQMLAHSVLLCLLRKVLRDLGSSESTVQTLRGLAVPNTV